MFHSRSLKLVCTALALVMVHGLFVALVSADNKHKGRHRGGHGYGHGFTGLAITPAGVGITFQNRNFGIAIAPGTVRSLYHGYSGGDGYIDSNPHFESRPFIAESVYSPAIVGPTIEPTEFGQSTAYQPVPEPAGVVERSFLPTNPAASGYQSAAETAFRDRDYSTSLRAIRHALLDDPENGYLHLFASQVYFAIGDYETATDAILVATELLDPADWFYVVKNFRTFYRGNEYVEQMDQLNRYSKTDSRRSFAQSLQAYHFFGLEHSDAAYQIAQQAIDVNPNDRLARILLTQFQPRIDAPVPQTVLSNAQPADSNDLP